MVILVHTDFICFLKKLVPTYYWKMATKKVDKKILLKPETGPMMGHLLFFEILVDPMNEFY